MSNINDFNFYDYFTKVIQSRQINDISPLLQDDYGKDNDCTLTSITTVIKWLKPSLSINNIYNNVEKIAKKFLYTGNFGTLTLTIKSIYKQSLQVFGINKKVKSYYLKNIGFNKDIIINNINNNQPVLLNLWNDGRNYYKNHSVLIIGYKITENNDFILTIYDNWYKHNSYIDYNKLSIISSIITIN